MLPNEYYINLMDIYIDEIVARCKEYFYVEYFYFIFWRLTAVESGNNIYGKPGQTQTDALLSLFHTKGGNAGQQISDILNMLNQVCDYFVVGLSKVPIFCTKSVKC